MLWAAADREDPSVPPQVTDDPVASADRNSVLVVEDEVMIRFAVSEHLRRRGYRVLEASTGEEAQTVVSAGPKIALVFADINLGRGIDGLDLARWIRSAHPEIRIVLSSGRFNATAVGSGVADAPLLEKPYSYDVLAALIERTLSVQ